MGIQKRVSEMGLGLDNNKPNPETHFYLTVQQVKIEIHLRLEMDLMKRFEDFKPLPCALQTFNLF
jgi:hypothetical protein